MKYKFYTLVLTAFFSCSQSIAQSGQYGLLWEITGNGLNVPSYLYGTVHLRDPRVFNLGDSVYYAIHSSPLFALEIDMDSVQIYLCRQLSLADNDSSKTDNLIDKTVKDKEKTERYFKKGDRSGSVKKPASFLDMYLYRVAKEENKEIYGLEPYRNQLDNMDKRGDWSKEEEFFLMLQLNRLIENYEKGDLEGIEQMFAGAAMDSFRIKKRNEDMLRSIISLSQQDGLFAAVGAAHLYGQEGLVALLQAKGYQLRRMQPGKILPPLELDEVPDYTEWETFTDAGNRFTIQMPGSPCNSVTQEGIDMNIYLDPYTQQAFGAGSGMTDISVDEKTMYKHVMNHLLLKGIDTKNIKLKKFKTKDNQGVSFILPLEGYSIEYRWYFHRGYIHFMFHGKPDDITDITSGELFFNSVQFKELELIEGKMQDTVGAFEITFPGQPISQTIDLSEPDQPKKFLYQWMFADPIQKTQYLCQYFDIGLQELYDNEWQTLESIASSLTSEYDQTSIQQDTLRLNGYPVQTMCFKAGNNSFLGHKLIIRGNRLYLLLISSLQEVDKEDSFFKSFSLLPFTTQEFETSTLNDGHFSLLAPGPAFVEIDSSYFHNTWEGNQWKYFRFYDRQNSSVISVKQAELSPYFEYVWSDSLVNEFNDFFSTDGDSLREYQDSLAGFASHGFLSTSGAGNSIAVEFFLSGNTLYAIHIMMPGELDTTAYADGVIKSFKLLQPPKAVADKAKSALLLEDLRSEDPLTRKKAVSAIPHVDFLPEEFPTIESYLLMDWPDDTLFYGTRYKLIEKYAEIRQKQAIPLLIKSAEKIDSGDAFISPLIAGLLILDTLESNAIADSLLKINSLNRFISGFDVLNSYFDSSSLFRQHLPKLISYYDHPSLNDAFENLLIQHLDDTLTDIKPFLMQISDSLMENFETNVDSFLKYPHEEDYDLISKINGRLNLLNSAGKFESIKPFFEKLMDREINYLSNTCMLILLENQAEYEEKVLINLLMDTFNAPQLVFEAVNKGIFHRIPSKLYNEKQIAEFDLISIAYEDYWNPTLSYREKRELSEREATKNYYVFEIASEGDENTYLGISGPYPLTKTNGYYNNDTTFSYTALTDDNYETILRELFERLGEDTSE